MIVHDVKQGTPAWKKLRLGIPTASEFSRILTPAKLQYAKGARSYIYQLLAEWYTGLPQDEIVADWTIYGTAMEGEAVRWYEFDRNVTTTAVGFITTDDGRIGCSPDRLIGDDGGLEIKCPMTVAKCIGAMLGESTDEYRAQVQGCLWVTGRAWWDLMIYHPDMPPIIRRCYPEDEWFAAWEEVYPQFLADMDAAKEKLKADGLEEAEIGLGDPDAPAGECSDCGDSVTVADRWEIEGATLCGPCYYQAITV